MNRALTGILLAWAGALMATQGTARAQPAGIEFKGLERLAETPAVQPSFLPSAQADAWERKGVLFVSSTRSSDGGRTVSTPFEITARRGTSQWSISGLGLTRIETSTNVATGLADLLLAYDSVLAPIGAGVLAGRLGVSVPTGTRVSADRAMAVGALVAQLPVGGRLTLVPLGILVYDPELNLPSVSDWAQEVRFKLQAQATPWGGFIGVRRAYRDGVPSPSTLEVAVDFARGTTTFSVGAQRVKLKARHDTVINAGVSFAF